VQQDPPKNVTINPKKDFSPVLNKTEKSSALPGGSGVLMI
jgi:hypothetical protein